MKFPVLATAAITALLSFQSFSSDNNWVISYSEDEMTGEFSAYTSSLRVTPLKPMGFPYRNVNSWLGVGCNSGAFWVYLGFNEAPHISRSETRDGFDYIDTRVKWGEDVVNEGLTQEWGSRFIHFSKVKDVLERIKSSKKLKVELNWYKQGKQYFEYDLSGSAKSIENILAQCSKQAYPETEKKSNAQEDKYEPDKLKPIVKIKPKYPRDAAKEGVEGWVSFSFDINEVGGVENIVVLDASPKGIFEREARRALRKWKYRPLIVDGSPQKNSGVTEIVEFKISH